MPPNAYPLQSRHECSHRLLFCFFCLLFCLCCGKRIVFLLALGKPFCIAAHIFTPFAVTLGSQYFGDDIVKETTIVTDKDDRAWIDGESLLKQFE